MKKPSDAWRYTTANEARRPRAPVLHSMIWRSYMPSYVRSPSWSATQSWRHESMWPVRSCVQLPCNRPLQGALSYHPESLTWSRSSLWAKENALIGAHLGLAESTVKSYLASAMRKLEATNRFEVVLLARRKGLIR
ncbi:response regulator transcription factor [Glutamicibacter ardleyensis]|uniref:response regulator transcription factor n=1 Tax=Glutamicibacter ardleyensis TaxID=225894 RepID=UPI003FD026E3